MAIVYIDGAAMPAPSGISVALEDIGDDAGRNALGEKVVDRIAVKRVIELEWAHLTSQQLAVLMTAAAGIFFAARYPDPATGEMRDMQCRAAERRARVHRADGLRPEWAEIYMKWEER
ncbi:MAG: hypothetical protein ACOYI5_06090 [Christensenellales bacterium]|jgi:hypothetical protein